MKISIRQLRQLITEAINHDNVNDEIKQFFLQEVDDGSEADNDETSTNIDASDDEGPASASSEKPTGFYTSFDMARDHMGTDDLQSFWYRSPGRAAGTEGDPYRSEDPYVQLGFRNPDDQGSAGPEDTVATDVPDPGASNDQETSDVEKEKEAPTGKSAKT